jgi:hypothetical protein
MYRDIIIQLAIALAQNEYRLCLLTFTGSIYASDRRDHNIKLQVDVHSYIMVAGANTLLGQYTSHHCEVPILPMIEEVLEWMVNIILYPVECIIGLDRPWEQPDIQHNGSELIYSDMDNFFRSPTITQSNEDTSLSQRQYTSSRRGPTGEIAMPSRNTTVPDTAGVEANSGASADVLTYAEALTQVVGGKVLQQLKKPDPGPRRHTLSTAPGAGASQPHNLQPLWCVARALTVGSLCMSHRSRVHL